MTDARSTPPGGGAPVWPSLPFEEWSATHATLHRWIQIVGQTRFALSSPLNHWWHAPLYLTARGLTTSPIPLGERTLEVHLDLVGHNLLACTSDGATRALALVPRTVADFYREYLTVLRTLGVEPAIYDRPVQIEEDPIPFPEDRTHASYDARYVTRFFRILAQVDQVLKRYRGRFIGKCSPVHLFWGRLDLVVTRFSGRRASLPAGADEITREAYSHEFSACGFWPRSGRFQAPGFYSRAHPEPPGFREAPVRPSSVFYDPTAAEFVLPYDEVRSATAPEDVLLDFFQSTYEAAADRGGWDRAALERPAGAG